MNDVRTLAAARQRRAWARGWLATRAMDRQTQHVTEAFSGLGVSSAEAFENMTDLAITFQVAQLWEQA